jgi:hypothetical protein
MKNVKMPKLVQGICQGCEIMDEFLIDQYGCPTPCRNCDHDAAPSEIIIVWEA